MASGAVPSGSGRQAAATVVLVHGTGADGEVWRPLSRSLGSRYRVLAPHLSGSRHTTDDGGALTLSGLAAQVVSIIEDEATGPVHLAGHSLGAAVAAQVAATRPESVVSLALICGWIRTDGAGREVLDRWSQAWAAGVGELARLLVLSGISASYRQVLGVEGVQHLVEVVAGMLPPGTDRQIAVSRIVDLREVLPRVQAARTLVVGCAQDDLVPVRRQREQACAVPGARYVELDSGHLVMVERPRLLEQTLTDFWTAAESR